MPIFTNKEKRKHYEEIAHSFFEFHFVTLPDAPELTAIKPFYKYRTELAALFLRLIPSIGVCPIYPGLLSRLNISIPYLLDYAANGRVYFFGSCILSYQSASLPHARAQSDKMSNACLISICLFSL